MSACPWAPTDCQTLNGSVTVTFHAFQTKNLTNEPARALPTDDNVYNAASGLYYDGYQMKT